MQLDTLKHTLLDFVKNPCKSWGDLPDGEQYMNGRQANVTIEQADRNTARLRSGSYTQEQYADIERQLAQVEANGYGTARFDFHIPDSLEYEHVCVECKKPFASCLADADRCYDCCLLSLCPPLPGTIFHHWWYHDDRIWTLQVTGHVRSHGGTSRFRWYNQNSGGNVSHQGLDVHRTPEGTVQKIVFTTAAENAKRRYRIVWDLEANTTKFYTAPRAMVNDDMYTPVQTELEELDPFVLDFIVGMVPAFMLFRHRPRNPANGCFIG